MVAKMMRWRPWPPIISRKFDVKLTILRLEGTDSLFEGAEFDNGGLSVEIRWKGPKNSLGSFRRTVKRDCTREEILRRIDDPKRSVLVEWDEDFQALCTLSGNKDNVFHPWELNFTVLHALNQGAKNKTSVVASVALNLAEYASKIEEQAIEVKIPLTVSSIPIESRPLLCISIGLVELRAAQELPEVTQSPVVSLPSISVSNGTSSSSEKDEFSALKAGLRKVKIFTEYVSNGRAKKACPEESSGSAKSEEGDYTYSFDSESLNEFEEGESEEGKEVSDVRKSCSYGTLAYANYAGVSCYYSARNDNEEDWTYYSNRRRSDVGYFGVDVGPTIHEQSSVQNIRRSLLPWKKRKLSLRSPKAKGEPLLKKDHGEEGGDDIDFDRRQLSSDESLPFGWHKIDEDSSVNRSSFSEFGDDNFAVGTWEQKEITSRDGQMKIQTQVFFASIDQRSERAAGESACTALVAVVADWLQNNLNLMPVKSQFDSLIRDGSLEWRNLCDNEIYKESFPDKHFDLETVLQAKIRDLCVIPEKSFIGFFHPDETEEVNFDFLQGAMSFDNIWGEISQFESGEAPVFIVSWNDHFFVLKVESDAYYIIDTLGERLHEGCNQAYILKFDKNTAIYKQPSCSQSVDKDSKENYVAIVSMESSKNKEEEEEEEEVVVCKGKESCKEYIKNFLAAIPIRELHADIKKGLMASTIVHHRLQIEFHFTQLQEPVSEMSPAKEVGLRLVSEGFY